MANPDEELTVAQRLGRALDRGLLPAGGPAEAAERLIERLERPARIALLGLPGSGKSSILNLLVGTVVVPETLRLPTIIVQHGQTARMICTLTDGTTKILPGNDLAEVLPLAPALVTLEMDLAALKVISLLEVSAGPMEAEQKRAATWASKRSDIVIWCTTSYLPKEQVVWESLPDAVKDNSFMFLTKVDLLGSRQQASSMHDRVELRAGEEFRQILSISAKEARAAVPPGGPVNRELFRDSGAAAVIAAIKTRVQSGRRADTDTAELLLARHVEASELVARRFDAPGEVTEVQKPWTPPPEPEDVEDAAEVEAEDEVVEDVEAEDAAEEENDLAEDEAETEDAETDDVFEDEPEPEPEVEVEPEAEAEPERAIEIALAPVEPVEPATRRRFADRIKRVASDVEPVVAQKVPLRSTWKSKTDPVVEAPPPPPTPEPVRRPRIISQPPPDEGDVARMLASISATPDRPALPPRERTPRAVTPRPPAEPAPDEAASEQPKPFGAKRDTATGLVRGAPLPDLSSLRASPEEMAEANEAPEDMFDQVEDEADTEQVAAERDVAEETALAEEPFEEESATEEGSAEGAFDLPAEPEPQPDAPPPPKPATPVERPRLFGRAPSPKAAEPVAPPAPPPPQARTVPISRLPASARATAAPAAPPPPALDEAQFSPRAIMMRDRPAGNDQPAPRRERARIAARAMPAAGSPVASAPEIGTDRGVADEAVALILLRSAELEREIDPEAKVPVDLILDHARETGDLLQAVVSKGKSDAMRRINGDLGEMLDLIMLMQLEKGHAPADDALTLLLQLRRELETLRVV
jgi:hypothetical protein